MEPYTDEITRLVELLDSLPPDADINALRGKAKGHYGQSFQRKKALRVADMQETSDLLPSQLRRDGISEAIRVNPYLRLMLAIFNQELSDYAIRARNPKKYPLAHSSGRAWLYYTGPPQDLFSFESICMYFDWEPDWLAPKILKWMERIDAGWRPKMVNRSAPRPRNPTLAGRDRHSYNEKTRHSYNDRKRPR